jgi:hypothetical protein
MEHVTCAARGTGNNSYKVVSARNYACTDKGLSQVDTRALVVFH